ncbi:unnamed protein product [Cuscuta epithymum]|uniref:RNase H type-1 domain-containing protein n=1 Tax=Cuscuta epithymum TaxID=186058 RepID=A0AAV0FRU0_9ASTE|nr:unnamed protein product [Cuscuta epithymum]
MVMEEGFTDVQVESDSSGAISSVEDDSGNLTQFRREATNRGYSFGHEYREGSGPAHSLASHYSASGQLLIYRRVSNLPNKVKQGLVWSPLNVF